MRRAILVLLLFTGSVQAQQSMLSLPPHTSPFTALPRSVPLTDAAGKTIGTATFTHKPDFTSWVVLRDLKGELIASITVDKDGTKTMYDPNGKMVDQIKGQ